MWLWRQFVIGLLRRFAMTILRRIESECVRDWKGGVSRCGASVPNGKANEAMQRKRNPEKPGREAETPKFLVLNFIVTNDVA